MESEAERTRLFSRRSLLVGGAQLAFFGVLAGRMGYLAFIDGQRYALQAENNRVSVRLIPARRGLILDRTGKPLALNRDDYRLQLIPEETPDLEQTLAAITRIYPLSEEELARIRRDVRRSPRFMPVEIARGLDWDGFSELNVRLPDLPGVVPAAGMTRLYPAGASVGHLLGYMAVPNAATVEADPDPILRLPGFRVGKEGIEKAFDTALRGKAGAARVEVNAFGRVVRDLKRDDGLAGAPLHLTIDDDIQRFAAMRLEGEAASAIVMGVETGEILALASVPAYDPNALSDGISAVEWQALLEDERHPLINKPVQGLFPPGSTFKMIVALAGLESGLIDPADRVFCSGRYRLGSHIFHCWKRRGHGPVDMAQGIFQSCDTYFYDIGRKIGIERIAQMARRFGLGETFDLPTTAQKAGLVPDREWKQRVKRQPWLIGETLNAAIGQGYMLATPMHLAVMTARLASGRAVRPQLVRPAAGFATAPPISGIDPAHLAFVRQAMADVVNARGGTAAGARLKGGFVMAGKTGTAQVRRITMAERRRGVLRNEDLPWRFRDHALFVAYAPAEAPSYAISVVVEHGGSGSAAAAPVARDIMERVLARDPLGTLVPPLPDAPLAALQAPVGGR